MTPSNLTALPLYPAANLKMIRLSTGTEAPLTVITQLNCDAELFAKDATTNRTRSRSRRMTAPLVQLHQESHS